MLLELPGERRFLELAADRARRRHARVLRDRRAALDDALVRDVGPHRAGDAAHVDAMVLVEALVFDRDDRLLHDRRDLVGVDEDPALRSAQRREDRVVVVGIDVPVDLVRHLPRVAVRDLAGDCGDQPEAERARAEEKEKQEEADETELSDPAPAPIGSRRRCTASAAKQADDSSFMRRCGRSAMGLSWEPLTHPHPPGSASRSHSPEPAAGAVR